LYENTIHDIQLIQFNIYNNSYDALILVLVNINRKIKQRGKEKIRNSASVERGFILIAHNMAEKGLRAKRGLE
jgi:hypothetical protein